MLKPESLPIDKIYVPVKRRKDLKPEMVQEIASSILDIGQQSPILVRPDEDRFVLIEGLHRLEACKALGERAIIALVSAEAAHQKTLAPQSAEAQAERQKMERLRKLRLDRDAAEATAMAAGAVSETAERQRGHPERTTRTNLKTTPSQSGRGPSGSSPRTLSEWIKQRERDGGRY